MGINVSGVQKAISTVGKAAKTAGTEVGQKATAVVKNVAKEEKKIANSLDALAVSGKATMMKNSSGVPILREINGKKEILVGQNLGKKGEVFYKVGFVPAKLKYEPVDPLLPNFLKASWVPKT